MILKILLLSIVFLSLITAMIYEFGIKIIITSAPNLN